MVVIVLVMRTLFLEGGVSEFVELVMKCSCVGGGGPGAVDAAAEDGDELELVVEVEVEAALVPFESGSGSPRRHCSVL
eukprot:CAMPEP_0170109502 /NCGR_PEP_ID=MMETSP0020_2-20130122/7234_1 /TAXON_ID=98059 /ORGANISM="Dinobryon sp., Strain UTEXLB2267" /LENGTH=77 /DNA_ID=CAMNT_0010334485 /DNA_START=251 /DNA_END=485 /DNA_ORIENTATION=+